MFAGIATRDMDRFWATIDDECVLITDRRWPGGGEFRGREAIGGFVDEFLSAFAEIHFEESTEPVETERGVRLAGRWVGSGLASGIETHSFDVTVDVIAAERLRELDFRFA